MAGDLKIGRTVTRTVRIELSQEEVETIIAAHVMREHRSKLKDFGLKAKLAWASGAEGDEHCIACIVEGEAVKRADGST